jgi:hypothetical protein
MINNRLHVRPRHVVIAFIAIAWWVHSASAEPSKELQAALQQLAADNAAERQSAQDSIVQMGRDATEPLQQLIATTKDVEQLTGAQAAMARIQEQALIGPTYVSLKMTNATAEAIVGELSKQAGVSIKYTSNGGAQTGSFSINIDHQPFWTAVMEVCRVAGLNVSPRNGNLLALGNGGMDLSGPRIIDGPFMVIAQGINTNSNVQLAQPANINRTTNIQFSFFAEPKLRISQHPYNVKLSEAVDDTGRSLLMPAQNIYDHYGSDNQLVWQGSSQLAVLDPPGKRIARLKGQMILQAATKTDTIEIADIMNARNVTKSAGGQTLIVKNVTTEPGSTEVSLNVTILVSPDRGNLGYSLAQSIRLLDADGQALQHTNSSGSASPTKLEYKISYNKRTYDGEQKLVGDPVKLVLPIVVETRPVELNFEFKDLPLP